MATYDLSAAENDDTARAFRAWAKERFTNNKANIWSRESYDWLVTAKAARDPNDGSPSYVLADACHNLGSYEIKKDPRP